MRLFIYPSDIQKLTGKSIDTARREYNAILDSFGKIERSAAGKIIKKHMLTIRDYCMYNGLDESDVTKIINTPPRKV